ncbi:mu-type opioid receptor-like [Rhopilema esculentum]|uniref:mu-type opioid receptor-like n=1 Tax=Rhopilema esculentum TaxID=499914 RepID=UPI0031D5A0AE|eukprot:gene16221-7595_t
MSSDCGLDSNATIRFSLSLMDKALVTSTLSILAFLCITSNFLVCYIIATRRTTNSTARLYVFSLALTDVMVGLFSIPFFILLFMTKSDPGEQARALQSVFTVVDLTLQLASITHLCMMSVDRALAVVKPFYHKKVVTKSKVLKSLIIPWTAGFLSGISYLFLPQSLLAFFAYFMVIAGLFYVLPIIIMIICYACIFKAIRTRNKSKVGERINEFRLARTILVIILTFGVCWTPLTIHSYYNIFKVFMTCYRHEFSWVDVLIKAINYLNSTLNPFIYAILHPQFRVGFCELCKRRRKTFTHALTSGDHHVTQL